MAPLLLLALLAFPFAEIALLIAVGGAIGVFPTLALLVLDVLAGAALIRVQGFATLLNVRAALARGEPPTDALIQGACVVAAGFLLIVPGFLSDLLAAALLSFLPFRRLVWAWIWRRRVGSGGPVTIEGEYTVRESGRLEKPGERSSPWRRPETDGNGP